jgi:hypothetical protein
MTHDYEDILKIYDNLRRPVISESDAAKCIHSTESQDWIFGNRDMTV